MYKYESGSDCLMKKPSDFEGFRLSNRWAAEQGKSLVMTNKYLRCTSRNDVKLRRECRDVNYHSCDDRRRVLKAGGWTYTSVARMLNYERLNYFCDHANIGKITRDSSYQRNEFYQLVYLPDALNATLSVSSKVELFQVTKQIIEFSTHNMVGWK